MDKLGSGASSSGASIDKTVKMVYNEKFFLL